MKLIKPSARIYIYNTNINSVIREHSTVYLMFTHKNGWSDSAKYYKNRCSVVKENIVPETETELQYTERMVTTTYRVLYENGWLDDLKFACEATEHHEKRVSVHFVCDRDMLYKLSQHQNFILTENVDRIENDITFIEPSWIKEHDPEFCFHKDLRSNNSLIIRTFINSLKRIEEDYFCLATYLSHEDANATLPNCLKTEVIMTGFLSDWLGEIKLFNDKQLMRIHKWSPKTQCDIKNFIVTHKQKKSPSSKSGLKMVITGFFPKVLYPNGIVPEKNTQFQDLIKSLYMKFEEKGYINKYNT